MTNASGTNLGERSEGASPRLTDVPRNESVAMEVRDLSVEYDGQNLAAKAVLRAPHHLLRTIDRLEHGRGMISVVATRSYNHRLVVGCGRTRRNLATSGAATCRWKIRRVNDSGPSILDANGSLA